jgi:serine/threonine-protein kinase
MLSVGLLAAALFLAGRARAQPTGDAVRAEQLFARALGLLDAGKGDEACRLFPEVLRLHPSIGAQLNVAQCHERAGRTASAFAAFKKAAEMARSAGDGERAQYAQTEAARIEPRMSWLTIEVAARTPGLGVTRDGATVEPRSWGIPVAVDPGEHRIEARLPAGASWSRQVALTAGARAVVTVPELPGEIPVTPPVDASPPPTTAEGGDGGALVTAGIVLVAAGAAGAVAGLVLGGLALADRNEADALCPAMQCDAAGAALIDDARGKARAATVLAIAGTAVAAGGAAMILFAPSPAGEARGPVPRAGSFGVGALAGVTVPF